MLVVAPDADVATWAMEPIDSGLGRGAFSPLVLGPAVVPEVTDEALAKQEPELAILSAVAPGNGPSGLDVVQAVLRALDRLDPELAAAYFQIVYTALREFMRIALEAMVMERQAEAKANFPPFMQKLIDGGKREGEINGARGMLLRLVARAGIAFSDDDCARVHACTDLATLHRWIDNVRDAKTAADVLS